ncbi:MAG: aldo/keto reductase [Lachnospiraceae bacterium]|nr:aldo/keto reductase [Lachnospiraceae bacterium]
MEQRKNDWSILGFGCMRLPKKNGGFDMEEAEREIMYALEQGVNYFDTAYIYKGSEEALGKVMAKNHCREQMTIATKLPHYMIKSIEGLEKYFQEQLERLQTDYIDNYLMHMLPDADIWAKLVCMGVADWLKEKKSSGQIRHVGFSYHGNSTAFCELIDAYAWDFCQVQYNYMDEHSQAGRIGVHHAASKGIPVIIMEPLRGGRLVNGLPEQAKELFDRAKPKRSPAEWGLRWLWNQPEVSVILSGMNSMEMLQENIRIAEDVQIGELQEQDFALYDGVRKAINARIKVGCTGCSYCMPCPHGVDIPGAFRCYNVRYTDNFFTGMREYMMCTTFRAKRSNASLCKKCGKCEKHCPQGIEIRKELDQVVKHMENPVYKVIALFSKGMFKK